MLADVIMQAAAPALPAITAGIATTTAADGVTRIPATRIRHSTIHFGQGSRNAYYPYSYYQGLYYQSYPNTYSYYEPGYGYDGAVVAQVQRRLDDLGYYHGVVDGIMGPQTRAAIAAFESTHSLVVDGTITTRLLARMGFA
jgi:hypothetical protein